MKKFSLILAVAATVFSTTAAFADFTGSFAGFYAPANWTITQSGNPMFQSFSGVITSGAPDNVTIYGAFGFGTVQTTPLSIIDYSIALQGSGPQTVSFSYLFFRPDLAPLDTAQLLQNGTVVADLTLPVNASQQFTLSGVFNGGDTLDFRVSSANINQFDFLEIAPIPEPSTIALAGLSGAALLLQFRRKTAKS